MRMPGVASRSATQRFRQRFADRHAGHFRALKELSVSSIGLGTYLGDADDDTDARYAEAIRAALEGGCNLLDTAINYRCQRSERVIGRTLAALSAERAITREEVVLCTKGGYLAFDGSVPADPARYLAETVTGAGLARPEEVVDACHCLAPRYLDHTLQSSLANLQVSSLDIYYLHNPEQQLNTVDAATAYGRIEQAFDLMEQRATEGVLRYYGIATWAGLRSRPDARGYLSLQRLVQLAQLAGGSTHHFRVIQLPYNLAMPEAYTVRNQSVEGHWLTPLQAASELGLCVIASASLLQQQLARLPSALSNDIPGLSTGAQRALQFARSTPGITSALVGMQRRAHVEENLALSRHAPLTSEQIGRLLSPAGSA